jgi:hypothetical protein
VTEATTNATTPTAATATSGSSATDTTGLNPPSVNLTANSIVVGGGTISGTAPPNRRVVIYFSDIEIERAESDANGNWQIVLPGNLAPGNYVLRVVVLDADGKPIVSTPQGISVTLAPKPLLPVTGGEIQ